MGLYHRFRRAGRGGNLDLSLPTLGCALLKSVGALWVLGTMSNSEDCALLWTDPSHEVLVLSASMGAGRADVFWSSSEQKEN